MMTDGEKRPIVALASMAGVMLLFLASMSGGYYTYGVLTDTESTVATFQVGNVPVSSAGNSPSPSSESDTNQSQSEEVTNSDNSTPRNSKKRLHFENGPSAPVHESRIIRNSGDPLSRHR